MHEELADLISREGAIRRADHPRLARRCDWAIARGDLVALLRGVYVAPSAAADIGIRARAVCLADPDAVVVGRAAEALLGRKPYSGTIEVVSWRLHDRSWLKVRRRRLPVELVVRHAGIAVSAPALTAVDLAVDTDGASLDDALRTGVRLADLEAAHRRLGPRRGCRKANCLLAESRDEPWSPAERRAHVLLRQAGIGGWSANRRVRDRSGRTVAFLDLGFDALALAIEIDGDSWHLTPAAVLRDRARDQRLGELGWTVIRFRAHQIRHEPAQFLASIRTLLHVRGARACLRAGRGRSARSRTRVT